MADDEKSLVPSIMKTATDMVQLLPDFMHSIAPAWSARVESRRKIIGHITDIAKIAPDRLSEGDIAYLAEVLDESEAKWVTWKYVESQSEQYEKILAQTPEFSVPNSGNAPSPSFEGNLRARVSEVDPGDKVLLDLYAQIRAGEHCSPGSFSKKTCNLVGQLTPVAISSLEECGRHRVANLIPATTPWPAILLLEEYGLVSSSHSEANFGPERHGLILAGGKGVTWQEGKSFVLPGYKLSHSAVELLKIHDCDLSEETRDWLMRQIPTARNPQITSLTKG